MRILIQFGHGLGDAVQLTCVLQHLRKHRPDWRVTVRSLWGKHTAFRGLCESTLSDAGEQPSGQFDATFDLGWFENYNAYDDCPSTKATNCLREVFGIEPDPELLRYKIDPLLSDYDAAREFLGTSGAELGRNGRYKVVCLHYEGNTSCWKKNLGHGDARMLAAYLKANGYKILLLDWDDRSPLAREFPGWVLNAGNGHPLWGGGTGCAARIAAVIGSCAAFFGIDSGPGKVSGATDTPSVITWLDHHPMMFHDLCPNTLHLVPERHWHVQPMHRPGCREYFMANYRYEQYSVTGPALCKAASKVLGLPYTEGAVVQHSMLRAKNFHAEYYHEHKAAGLDYLGHGEWQEEYGRWVVEALKLKGQHVLDLGCACGSVALGLRKAGAISHGVDLNNYAIELGRKHFPDVPMYVCDAANLHLFGDHSFESVHCNQVAEHWRPELVPFILREVRRVLKFGGSFFCVLDTQELFDRQKRDPLAEDPTNQCVKPLDWWYEQCAAAGLTMDPETADAMRSHSRSYLKRYDWDYFVARRHELPPDREPPLGKSVAG